MDHTQVITDYTNLFLNQLAVTAQVKVEYDKDGDLYQITLNSEDPGVLIGHHGDTLSSLRTILAQHLKAKTGEWLNLTLNVNDYWQRREASLHAMADATIQQVLSTGQAHVLPPMPANERRAIHMYLSEHPQVTTSSDGEGRSRSVIISPK